MKYLRTSDLAKTVGVHTNTVRRYVDRGLLPPVESSQSGYRRFTQRHLDCLSGFCIILTTVSAVHTRVIESLWKTVFVRFPIS
jgi:hypothetical protein